MTQAHSRALVTMAIGDAYVQAFERDARPSWHAYCNRHGYDLIVITEVIDRNCDLGKKSLHWQKLLIPALPQVSEYEQVAWVDSDIVINDRAAPCLFADLPRERIGVVDETAPFEIRDESGSLHSRYNVLATLMQVQVTGTPPGDGRPVTVTDGTVEDYYRFFGFPKSVSRNINSGVFAFDPKRHGEVFLECYARHDRDMIGYENLPLSYELQAGDLVHALDRRFNVIWGSVAAWHYPFLFNGELARRNPDLMRLCVNTAYRNAYFLHFSGDGNSPLTKGAAQLIDRESEGVAAQVFPDLWARRNSIMTFAPLATAERRQRPLIV